VSTLFPVAKKNTQRSFLEAAARERERDRESLKLLLLLLFSTKSNLQLYYNTHIWQCTRVCDPKTRKKKDSRNKMGDEEQEYEDLQVYNDGAAAAAYKLPSSCNYKSTREQKEGEKERKKGAPRLSKRKSKRKRKTKGTYYSFTQKIMLK
jgi:hypothetical protein